MNTYHMGPHLFSPPDMGGVLQILIWAAGGKKSPAVSNDFITNINELICGDVIS